MRDDSDSNDLEVATSAGSQNFPTEPLRGYSAPARDVELEQASREFWELSNRRRSVRDFASIPIPASVIRNCIAAAGSAPSGANLQPWHFAAVQSAEVKHEIRIAAEKEEQEFYSTRAPKEWLDALRALGTTDKKPFLEVAPWLIAVFAKSHGVGTDGEPTKHYYVSESVGIATGVLISALNHCGIATLTHTPSPMRFLNTILQRPSNERPFLLLVVGYPSQDCHVPAITRRPIDDITSFH